MAGFVDVMEDDQFLRCSSIRSLEPKEFLNLPSDAPFPAAHEIIRFLTNKAGGRVQGKAISAIS